MPLQVTVMLLWGVELRVLHEAADPCISFKPMPTSPLPYPRRQVVLVPEAVTTVVQNLSVIFFGMLISQNQN